MSENKLETIKTALWNDFRGACDLGERFEAIGSLYEIYQIKGEVGTKPEGTFEDFLNSIIG